MAKTRLPYAPEFRRQMVELVHAGRTPEELAAEFEPTAQSRPVARAVEREAQEVDGFRALSAVSARVSLREPPELDQLGLGRFQREAEPFQPIPQRVL